MQVSFIAKSDAGDNGQPFPPIQSSTLWLWSLIWQGMTKSRERTHAGTLFVYARKCEFTRTNSSCRLCRQSFLIYPIFRKKRPKNLFADEPSLDTGRFPDWVAPNSRNVLDAIDRSESCFGRSGTLCRWTNEWMSLSNDYSIDRKDETLKMRTDLMKPSRQFLASLLDGTVIPPLLEPFRPLSDPDFRLFIHSAHQRSRFIDAVSNVRWWRCR